MNKSTRITKRVVDEAKACPKDTYIRDTDVRGFGLKITPASAKVYFLEFRMPGGRGSPKGRFIIGRHGSPWTPETARKHAIEILEGVRKGINPVSAKLAKHRADVELAFSTYADHFFKATANLISVDPGR
jgi:hypothetical protein